MTQDLDNLEWYEYKDLYDKGLIPDDTELPKWLDNSIQFPRLIAEILAVGLDEQQWDDLLTSMDLESDDLSELFDRAQYEWEKAKEQL
jgi:hypothetical protein